MSGSLPEDLLGGVRATLEAWLADGMDHVPRLERRAGADDDRVGAPQPKPPAPTPSRAPVARVPELRWDAPPAGERAEALERVRQELGDCARCGLCSGRTHIVFGEGNPEAPVVFVGEGPGADEDRTGRPFVGRAGELLTRMIGAIGFRREDVYICNIVKCRPPKNRAPLPDEVAACSPFLVKQLEAIGPRAIVALGKPAASTLLGRNVAITKQRGIWEEWNGIPLMPTFHPAYLLRNYTRETRQAVWDDLRAVRARVDDEAERD